MSAIYFLIALLASSALSYSPITYEWQARALVTMMYALILIGTVRSVAEIDRFMRGNK